MAACEGERDSWAGEGDAQFRLEGGGVGQRPCCGAERRKDGRSGDTRAASGWPHRRQGRWQGRWGVRGERAREKGRGGKGGP